MYQKVTLLGRLGSDPELKDVGNTQVATFGMATDRRVKKDGNWEKETDWHRIVAWGKTAEAAEKYLNKGDVAFIEGRVSYREWKNREGEKRKTTEIVANEIKFLPSGKGGGKSNSRGGGDDFGDDDIPF